MSFEGALPQIRTAIPGPKSRAAVDRLSLHECPAITARRARRADAMGTDNDDPIVWKEAHGALVTDVDDNVFIDLTSGFAVSLLGHRHPAIVQAAQTQAERCLHAMGDCWPDITRIDLLDVIADITPGKLDVSILGLSGSDAVEAAIKTAVLHTSKTGILTFERGYHGLSLGALNLQGYKPAFTEPFEDIVHPHCFKLPFGADADDIEMMVIKHDIGLVMVEPIQGRGGMHPAPEGWLATLRRICDTHGALLAFDEIQCGLGRTGHWFACEHDQVTPDLLCLGKALAGGYPLSACIGTMEVMASWGDSKGEAIHTQTFLGHPVGCAAALASLKELMGAMPDIRRKGELLHDKLMIAGFVPRGRGLMLGFDIGVPAMPVSRALLRRGFLCLPAGATSLSLTPPMCLTLPQFDAFLTTLNDILSDHG